MVTLYTQPNGSYTVKHQTQRVTTIGSSVCRFSPRAKLSVGGSEPTPSSSTVYTAGSGVLVGTVMQPCRPRGRRALGMSDAPDRRLEPEPCSARCRSRDPPASLPPAIAPSAPAPPALDGSRVAETVVTAGASISPDASPSIAAVGCCWKLAGGA
eukprot:scaffold13216_cov69-Phaeocystis_antarctica.AAC.3